MDWLRELQIDLDRLEYYEQKNNEEKVNEYKNLVVSHVRMMLEDSNENI